MVPEGSLDSIESDPTRCGGRNVWGNGLGGTLPAELGKLTDLEELCAPPLGTATAGRTARRADTLWWCAENVTKTSSAARSAAGSARCRSSPTCERPSAHGGWGARLHIAGWCGYCTSYGRRRRSLDSIRRALWQGICGDRPGRHAAGGARQAHGPRASVSCSAPPLGTALVGRAARHAYTLWWCAENVTETTSAARSVAGSARWRSSPTCKPPPLRTGVGAATYGGVVRVLHGTAGYSSTIHECCGHCLG